MSSDKWQPIETAPKDGTWIMIYEPYGGGQNVDLTHWIASWGDYGHDEGWIDQDDALVTRNPTHWQPLPTPPEGQSE